MNKDETKNKKLEKNPEKFECKIRFKLNVPI